MPQNLMQPFPHPKDATDKIWLKLVNWSWRYFCSKVWTTTDDGALLYYKLTLWAFGSGELKQNLVVVQTIIFYSKTLSVDLTNIMSMGKIQRSRTNNSKVNNPIRPKFELILRFYACPRYL